MGVVANAFISSIQDTEAGSETLKKKKKAFPRYLSVIYFSLLYFEAFTAKDKTI